MDPASAAQKKEPPNAVRTNERREQVSVAARAESSNNNNREHSFFVGTAIPRWMDVDVERLRPERSISDVPRSCLSRRSDNSGLGNTCVQIPWRDVSFLILHLSSLLPDDATQAG